MIDSLEKDILQRDPSIQWNDVAGLNDAKAILQEAVVLPVIMPEFFKGIRRPWKVRKYTQGIVQHPKKINLYCRS